MLKNSYFLAKIGAVTAENEHQFAEILPIGRRVADPAGVAAVLTLLVIICARLGPGSLGVPRQELSSSIWVANKDLS